MTHPVSFINQYANHPVHLCHMYDIKLTPLYLKLNDAAEGHLPVKSKEIDPNQAKALFLTDAQFVAKNLQASKLRNCFCLRSKR